MIQPISSPLVRLASQILFPMVWVFGLYVLFHGHESPGGGFQAGTLLAAAIILEVLACGKEAARYQFVVRHSYKLAAFGVFIYAGTGLFGLFAKNSWYLDYDALPIPVSPADHHWWGLFIIEAGVTIVVTAALVAIFNRLTETEPQHG